MEKVKGEVEALWKGEKRSRV